MTAVESNRFFEFLAITCASLEDPNEQLLHQTFEIPKRLLEEIDNFVKNGQATLNAADERRIKIQTTAWRTAKRRVLDNWKTRDMLDEAFMRYKVDSGQEREYTKGNQNPRRTEALRQFEDTRQILAGDV